MLGKWRRFWSAVLPVIALLGASPGPARADDANTLSLRLEWIPWGYHLHIFLAAEKGWFKQAGLDVTITDGNGSATTVQLVGAGQFDVGQASLANMAFARGKGMPLIAIADFWRKGDLGLFVPKESSIHGPKDLAGKTIVYSAGSLEAPFMDPFLAAGGLKRDQVNLLNVDAAAKLTPYVKGDADGIVTSEPFVLPLVQEKRPTRALMFADFGLAMPSSGLFVREDVLKKKGPALRKFASILAGALTYVRNGHVDEAIAALEKQRPQLRADPKILAAQFEEANHLINTPGTENLPIGVQTTKDWAEAIAVMEKANAIPKGTKPADYFTNDCLDAAMIKSIGGS